MKYIDLLYYKYYISQLRLGNRDVAPFSAMLMIAFILMLYYFDFFIFLSVLLPKTSPDLSWKFNILLLLTFIVILYFKLVYKGKFKKILKDQEKNDQKKGKLLSVFIPLLAIILFFLGFILKILQNQGKL